MAKVVGLVVTAAVQFDDGRILTAQSPDICTTYGQLTPAQAYDMAAKVAPAMVEALVLTVAKTTPTIDPDIAQAVFMAPEPHLPDQPGQAALECFLHTMGLDEPPPAVMGSDDGFGAPAASEVDKATQRRFLWGRYHRNDE